MKNIFSSFLIALLFLSFYSCSQNTKSDYSTHGKTDSGRVHLYAKTYDAVQMKKAAGYEPEALPPYNTESYALITENDFRKVSDEPLSTFSIDVDNASYSNTRRFIMEERFPPKDAVRIEELINYFEYDYEKPSGKHPFSVHMEVSDCPWNSENRLVHIGLKGKEIPKDEVPPSNIVFLLDVSGSMDMPNKLPLLKSAFRMLVRELTEKDRVAIVVYAGASGQVLPATPGNEKRNIIAALDKLEAGGSTAGAAGIELAYKVAAENFIKEGNNRVIIATDGDFNVGVSSDAELVRLIEEKRDKGIFLSVLGFGTGNYKDSKMEQLADKGNGNYAYIDNIQEARKVLVTEMLSTLYAIAKDVKLQVEFNPAQVSAYRLIGYENRMLHNEDFDDDKKDAGEMGIGHTVTALYEIVPAVEGKDTNTATRKLKYQEQNIKASAFHDPDILTLKLRYKLPEESKSILFEKTVSDGGLRLNNSSDNFRFAAAVAGWGMLLRDSKYKGDNNYAAVLRLAKTALGEDKNGYRKEFVKMVELCEAISDEGISAEK